ncbi:DegT/DnrJ/EryC1/StrS family aminotransferase [Tardiphaga sp. vice352]|uniref:DegT/DnrJ/EryC1/StrS family aminotransferase n=1 Tax=unclassified Tardiphaga TaxID=2631404 RepID=UPI0011622461|nr:MULTISPECIES: DegT/DnrJ/EryC1/StrS family aminotransferase [unclassified Tardiphaga]MBC7586577.1 DegT/DnrJ/EryC1/StrS family aminotransferase [Tardiphaga sp.]QDM17804.1 DegT/DnrJ/EryC1/StrS family aminotransferase [Tardiphaga sp. vice278]QDM22864.1 DegT/DnrJ/EryC1/StrS family aminotransferase [Tardiphaga sp. vice154]QDM28023.1 DegT/DnrJ/EryC1/StrS family aminotransferase [Tardiphaga sp. vice304]QDM33165.1 DegT/DnrJ/EryC1/StrS family aminotransferase [Tardiphaga sp. vice352]
MNQHTRVTPVPFIDIGAQRRRLGPAIDEAVGRVLTHCQFIGGPEVTQLEAALAAYSGAKHVISCASGTDALLMVLMAKGVGPGDAVLCPSFTYCATGEAVALTGATPVFVDVDEATYNIDIASLKRAVVTARQLGLKPRAIIPVDLFGQPADHDAVADVARAEGLFVLDDAAQAFGATYKGKRLGTAALATATSFFPAKPLGCYGDGGAILTDDDQLADVLRSIRVHGQGTDKYDNVRLGLTGRLDTIQAAVLLEKLKIFDDEIAARNKVAERYARSLGNIVTVPRVTEGNTSIWACYTIRLPKGTDRAAFAAALQAQGVPSAIYYVKSVHMQTAYAGYPVADGGLPVCEALSSDVISLPVHAYLDEPTQERVIKAVRDALA